MPRCDSGRSSWRMRGGTRLADMGVTVRFFVRVVRFTVPCAEFDIPAKRVLAHVVAVPVLPPELAPFQAAHVVVAVPSEPLTADVPIDQDNQPHWDKQDV